MRTGHVEESRRGRLHCDPFAFHHRCGDLEKSGIPAADLITVGYGKTKLKDPEHPLSEVNRRVQVVNTENKATASK